MTVVYVQPFTVAEIGMDPEWVVAFYTGIGAILTAAVFAVLWFLFRRATESDALTLALLMYGLLTIAGTFLGRYDSPHEVFMPRYVRHFYCIPVGLLVFALSRARPIFSLQSAGVRTLLALIVCGIVVFRAPSGVRRFGSEAEWYRGPTRLLADYSPELTSQELEAYHPMLHRVGRANDESAHRVLAWTLERVIEKEPTEP